MTYGFLLAVTGLAVAHASKVAVDVNTKVSVRRCRERDAVFFQKLYAQKNIRLLLIGCT